MLILQETRKRTSIGFYFHLFPPTPRTQYFQTATTGIVRDKRWKTTFVSQLFCDKMSTLQNEEKDKDNKMSTTSQTKINNDYDMFVSNSVKTVLPRTALPAEQGYWRDENLVPPVTSLRYHAGVFCPFFT